LEIGLAAEDDIGGEFHLHEAPVITSAKAMQDRTEALRPSIQTPMQTFGIEAIGKPLSLFGIEL
jgi:hypothetical protein